MVNWGGGGGANNSPGCHEHGGATEGEVPGILPL